MSNKSSICPVCDDIPPCPPCSSGEVCQQTYPLTCASCPTNICVRASSDHSHGVLIGAIVGGCVGAILLVFCLYFFYRKLHKALPIPCSPPRSPSAISSIPMSCVEHSYASREDSPVLRSSRYYDPTDPLWPPPSNRDLWRISEQGEPVDTTHLHGSPFPSDASPKYTSTLKADKPSMSRIAYLPKKARGTASFSAGTPRRTSHNAHLNVPHIDTNISRDSKFYSFLNELVDEYEDHSDYGSFESAAPSTRATLSHASSSRLNLDLSASSNRANMNMGDPDLVQTHSKLRTRQNVLIEVKTPEGVIEDPFSESIRMSSAE